MDRSRHANSSRRVAELAGAAEAGNKKAFRSLYELEKDRVYHTVLMLVGSAETAAAVTADVFVELYRDPPESPADFSVSMYRATVEKCTPYMNGHSGRQETSARAQAVSGAQGAGRKKQLHRLVAAAMNELHPELRIPFVLCEAHGLPYDQIARILGTTTRNVASRLASAREQLAEALGEVDFEAWNVG